MKLVKLDLQKHDLNKVSELIYETDSETFNSLFSRKENAIKRIKRLVKNGKNSLGYERIYVVIENKQILGLLVYSKGNEISIKEEYKAFFNSLSLWDAIKFVIFDIKDRLILSKLNENDYYLAGIAVDENFRGKGVGTFILDEAVKYAKEEGCVRIVLDVDLENDGALRLYKRVGFKIFGKRSFRWFNGEIGAYNMEYLI